MTFGYESSEIQRRKAMNYVHPTHSHSVQRGLKEIPHDAIFVGNLSYFCSESILTTLFQQYGLVSSVTIQRSRKNLPLHYGFVDMAPMDAERAINALNNLTFMGRQLRVSWRRGNTETKSNVDKVPVHVSFFSFSTDFVINEEYLGRIFGCTGGLVDCVVKHHRISSFSHKQTGYAFLYFHDEASAERALQLYRTNSGNIDGVTYDCKRIDSDRAGEEVHGISSDSLDSSASASLINRGPAGGLAKVDSLSPTSSTSQPQRYTPAFARDMTHQQHPYYQQISSHAMTPSPQFHSVPAYMSTMIPNVEGMPISYPPPGNFHNMTQYATNSPPSSYHMVPQMYTQAPPQLLPPPLPQQQIVYYIPTNEGQIHPIMGTTVQQHAGMLQQYSTPSMMQTSNSSPPQPHMISHQQPAHVYSAPTSVPVYYSPNPPTLQANHSLANSTASTYRSDLSHNN